MKENKIKIYEKIKASNSVEIFTRTYIPKTALSFPKNSISVVIMAHGWLGKGSNRRHGALLYYLMKENMIGVNFDFMGHNQSTGDILKFKLTDGLNDIKAVYEKIVKLKEQYNFIDLKRVGLVGTSIGGTVSLLACAKKIIPIKTLVLVSPRSNFKDTDPKTYKVDRNINREIRNEGLSIDFYKEAENISQKTLIIHGTKDENVDYKQSVKLAKVISNCKLISPETNHIYSLHKDDHYNMVNNIKDWLKNNL